MSLFTAEAYPFYFTQIRKSACFAVGGWSSAGCHTVQAQQFLVHFRNFGFQIRFDNSVSGRSRYFPAVVSRFRFVHRHRRDLVLLKVRQVCSRFLCSSRVHPNWHRFLVGVIQIELIRLFVLIAGSVEERIHAHFVGSWLACFGTRFWSKQKQ